MGNDQGRDSGGRWMTPTGADVKMQINRVKYMKEGLCFICGGKGHIGKNCLIKTQTKKVRPLEVAKVPLSADTKIEEVKD